MNGVRVHTESQFLRDGNLAGVGYGTYMYIMMSPPSPFRSSSPPSSDFVIIVNVDPFLNSFPRLLILVDVVSETFI